jgi:hypothetical protein
MNYEIRKLSFEDGVAAEELVRQVFHSKSRLSLRHAPNLFNFYRFLSAHDQFADVNFWGAFRDPQTMTGLTGFVNYELQLDVPGMKCFYNSDSLVLPDHTGRGVYLKLLDRQTDFFNSLECIPLSWGIEHHPGKLNGMKTYLEKRGGILFFQQHPQSAQVPKIVELNVGVAEGKSEIVLHRDNKLDERERIQIAALKQIVLFRKRFDFAIGDFLQTVF